jgi:predicted metal-binding membrane protein
MAPALPASAPLRSRITVLAGLVTVILAGWIYLLRGAGIEPSLMDMGAGETMAMRPEWTPRHALLVLSMWTVMMAAMMLPGAARAILAAAGFAARPRDGLSAALPFALGYLAPWAGFGLAATVLQWGLDSFGLLSPESMALGDARLAGSLLITIGLYQLTPWKQRFLSHCRASEACGEPSRGAGILPMLHQGIR